MMSVDAGRRFLPGSAGRGVRVGESGQGRLEAGEARGTCHKAPLLVRVNSGEGEGQW